MTIINRMSEGRRKVTYIKGINPKSRRKMVIPKVSIRKHTSVCRNWSTVELKCPLHHILLHDDPEEWKGETKKNDRSHIRSLWVLAASDRRVGAGVVGMCPVNFFEVLYFVCSPVSFPQSFLSFLHGFRQKGGLKMSPMAAVVLIILCENWFSLQRFH